MECIPCKLLINIDYTNLFIRNGLLTPTAKIFSEVEGCLLISLENKLIFSETGILLLELAKVLNNWIHKQTDHFNYYSMDYEDGPILSFAQDTSGWQFSSIWMNDVYSGLDISQITRASIKFIKKLSSELSLQQINLDSIL